MHIIHEESNEHPRTKKEVFENMNTKELIFSVPTRELAARHIAQLREMPDTQISDSNLETAIANMSAFIEKLAGIEPIETNHIILGIRYLIHDEESLSASLFQKNELLSDFDRNSEIGDLRAMPTTCLHGRRSWAMRWTSGTSRLSAPWTWPKSSSGR